MGYVWSFLVGAVVFIAVTRIGWGYTYIGSRVDSFCIKRGWQK